MPQDPATSLIIREIEQGSRLLEILQQEHTALTQRDLLALEQVTREKHHYLSSLEELAQQQPRQTATMPDRALWQQLHAVFAQCDYQNQINGAILKVSRYQIEQALAILHGRILETGLYDAKGIAPSNVVSKPLASA